VFQYRRAKVPARLSGTNANGLVEFVTIYPVGIQAERFTSTLRFAPFCIPAGLRVYLAALLRCPTDQIHAQPLCAKEQRTLKNDQDGIFRDGVSNCFNSLQSRRRLRGNIRYRASNRHSRRSARNSESVDPKTILQKSTYHLSS